MIEKDHLSRDARKGSGQHSWIAGIDGLRAMACLAVFGVHWQQLTGLTAHWGPFDAKRLLVNGNTGVALFMILSGYLLSRPLFNTEQVSRTQHVLADYWRNRALRILPAYWICLAALVLISGRFRSPGHWFDVVVHGFFLHNLFPPTLFSINPPFWALAVFVQFYCVFYVVVLVLQRLAKLTDRVVLLAFTAATVLSQGIVLVLAAWESPSTSNSLVNAWLGRDAMCLQHSLLIHMPVFWVGMVVGWLDVRLSRWARPVNDLMFIVATGIILITLATPLDQWTEIAGTRYHFPLIPVLLGAIVFLVPRTLWVSRCLEFTPIRLLGVVSYAFYLFHLPAMKLMAKAAEHFNIAWQFSPITFGLVAAVLTFGGCVLFDRWVESPLRRKWRSLVRRPEIVGGSDCGLDQRSF